MNQKDRDKFRKREENQKEKRFVSKQVVCGSLDEESLNTLYRLPFGSEGIFR